MNKQQLKQIKMIDAYIANNMLDTAARGLSAMIRSAMSNKSKQALMQYAVEHNLTTLEDFRV